MRTLPFYSLFRGMAVEDVWHNNTSCQIGGSIALVDRWPGTDERKHCPYCVLHNIPRTYGRPAPENDVLP